MLAAVLAAATLALLEAPGNPHDTERTQTQTSCCPAQALPVESFLPGALALARQQDTFIKVKRANHMGHSVDVFSFRQPARLSEKQLPFSLALVSSEINPSGIVELPAPAKEAADSWFPDYSWSHFIVCTSGKTPTHLGWRFTKKSSASVGPDSFVALIVRSHEDEEAEAAAARRVEVGVAAAVAEATTEEGEADADVEVDSKPALLIGEEAPGWMVAMLAAVTARQAASSA